VGRLFWKTRADTAPSHRCIGRPRRSVLIKNGRSWRKHLSMSVSRGRSSKNPSLLAAPRRDGGWQPPRRVDKGSSSTLKHWHSKEPAIVRRFHLVTPSMVTCGERCDIPGISDAFVTWFSGWRRIRMPAVATPTAMSSDAAAIQRDLFARGGEAKRFSELSGLG
jgi:hypothetical protein